MVGWMYIRTEGRPDGRTNQHDDLGCRSIATKKETSRENREDEEEEEEEEKEEEQEWIPARMEENGMEISLDSKKIREGRSYPLP